MWTVAEASGDVAIVERSDGLPSYYAASRYMITPRPAALVLVRPTGETLTFTCAEHREAWATRIRGPYLVLELAEWVARGRGYRGPMLGG